MAKHEPRRNLGELLLDRMFDTGITNQKDLTVMAPHRDPYRMKKYRAEGEWMAAQHAKLPYKPIHNRSHHYAAIGSTKPDGATYANTTENYEWLQDRPLKASRWLGLIPLSETIDQKNDAPQRYIWTPPDPVAGVLTGRIEIEELADDLLPKAALEDFRGVHPYKLARFAEKGAVAPVALPIAQQNAIDTYIEGGEISDTHLFEMSQHAVEDGRTMAVPLSDADPAGYWMPATIAYKLQAFATCTSPTRTLIFPILTGCSYASDQVVHGPAGGEPLPRARQASPAASITTDLSPSVAPISRSRSIPPAMATRTLTPLGSHPHAVSSGGAARAATGGRRGSPTARPAAVTRRVEASSVSREARNANEMFPSGRR